MDATVNLDFFPGSQVGGYMFGSSGSTRSKAALNREDDKGCAWHTDGTEITIHLDMEAKTCGFSVNDRRQKAVVFRHLPNCVYPAFSMSHGGICRFLHISSACSEGTKS